MKPIRLYRLGSDPEFAFVKFEEWDPSIIPAESVITSNKEVGLHSFIGIDNHPATAEIRPRAAHNVRQHLLDIAAGVVEIGNYLQKNPGLCMAAQPYIANEPLGGHIHLSFFYPCPQYARLLSHGLNYVNKLVNVQWNQHGSSPIGDEKPDSTDVQFVAHNWAALPTPYAFVNVMDYLLLPFESGVQLWNSRLKRNKKYGASVDSKVRWNIGSRPNMPEFREHAYLHYEYRVPSTWLVNPWLAFAYFALAKLTALNWEQISEAVASIGYADSNSEVLITSMDPNQPRNDMTWDTFDRRFANLHRVRRTRDLQDLEKSIEYCRKYRLRWLQPHAGVNFEAWRALLP